MKSNQQLKNEAEKKKTNAIIILGLLLFISVFWQISWWIAPAWALKGTPREVYHKELRVTDDSGSFVTDITECKNTEVSKEKSGLVVTCIK